MRASVICVGRLSREYQPVWGHYADLLRPYVDLEVFEAPESPITMGEEEVIAREGQALAGLLRKRGFTIAVDPRGNQYSSEEWSAFLAGRKVDGHSHFQFVLGGAFGLDSRLLSAAHAQWSLSLLTFPHQMARCIVLEQLYRALRIERGEPYHH